jgi:hypothetical protein
MSLDNLRVKFFIRELLLFSLGSIKQKIINFWINRYYPQSVIFDKENHITCGYYDICPFDTAEKKILAIQVKANKNPINKIFETASIGYYRLDEQNRAFNKVGQTDTWNWQQGCRLRWFPNYENQYVFYNDLIGDHYGSKIQDIDNKELITLLDYPIYDLDSNGYFGLSLNFSRLQRLRPGYGYNNFIDETSNDISPKNDGIWLVDIKKNNAFLLYSLNEIASIQPHKSMQNAEHYFNHLSFNPSGTSFLFFHLWVDEIGKRYSRLFTSETQGDNLFLLNNDKPVSHYTWMSDEHLLVTTIFDKSRTRYNLYHRKNGYEYAIGINRLITDGHPTFIDHQTRLVTDTYPDKWRIQKLMIYDIEASNNRIIDMEYSPTNFTGEIRCDLHPRTSVSDNLLCIDVVKKNRRAIKIINISKR